MGLPLKTQKKAPSIRSDADVMRQPVIISRQETFFVVDHMLLLLCASLRHKEAK